MGGVVMSPKAQPKKDVYEIVSKPQQQEAMKWLQECLTVRTWLVNVSTLKKHRLFRVHGTVQKTCKRDI
jgi:hypothetical protein